MGIGLLDVTIDSVGTVSTGACSIVTDCGVVVVAGCGIRVEMVPVSTVTCVVAEVWVVVGVST